MYCDVSEKKGHSLLSIVWISHLSFSPSWIHY